MKVDRIDSVLHTMSHISSEYEIRFVAFAEKKNANHPNVWHRVN